jgi:hypothetical protein
MAFMALMAVKAAQSMDDRQGVRRGRKMPLQLMNMVKPFLRSCG